ncbi:NAD-dependent epimerase/dehydratase family protein [Luteibacter yeojuensis]|uniref:Membrane protein n=1 Tax=Luteibacter yeojuensis TaxID=345309 RepID=A0A0F3KY78_9GAMM|nr:NAD(P)H-binding protein [Luteibacter yeojuensis]KJV36101.1 membrane protein [Luteibacter yeojuensis]
MTTTPSLRDRTALVLGATGGVGGEAARQLVAAGWHVRALTRRDPLAGKTVDGIEWRRGNAMRADDVASAAEGVAVIVHAVNPPGYQHWAEQVVPMIDNTIAAAVAEGATVVLPGTVYNFGPDAFPVLREGAPQHPVTRKGAIRVELEKRLREAATRGARAIVVRAGDFFGPQPGNSWFSQGLVAPGKPVTVIRSPARRGVGHQWAYLPDVARTMVALLERRDTLPAFCDVHFKGHWDNDGTEMPRAIQRVAARHGQKATIKAFPWWAMPLIAPFVPTIRELLEMRYLWKTPVRMTNDVLLGLLGEEPHTPLDRAVEATLAGLGCLPGRQAG